MKNHVGGVDPNCMGPGCNHTTGGCINLWVGHEISFVEVHAARVYLEINSPKWLSGDVHICTICSLP